MTQATHTEQIKTSITVAEKLSEHLERMVTRVDKFERRLLIFSIVMFASTENGHDLLTHVAGIFS